MHEQLTVRKAMNTTKRTHTFVLVAVEIAVRVVQLGIGSAMRRPAPIREGKWTEMPPYIRKRAHRDKCQVCGWKYDTMRGYGRQNFVMVKECVDHLIPRRYLESRGINPHQANGLLSICGSCHGRKKTIEDRLFRGDAVGWIQGLRSIGFPVTEIVNFAISVGLEEFKRLVSLAADRT